MRVRIKDVEKAANRHLINKVVTVTASRWSYKGKCAVYDFNMFGFVGNCIKVKHTDKVYNNIIGGNLI